MPGEDSAGFLSTQTSLPLLRRETMRQLNRAKALYCSVASVTDWSKIPFHRIEENLGSLPFLSSSNSIPLTVSVRSILKEENCIQLESLNAARSAISQRNQPKPYVTAVNLSVYNITYCFSG